MFLQVARNTRLMYVHAYQSYIWNTVVTHRVKKHGLQVVCGDLVIPHKSFTLTEGKML
jgi:tRNA pseudouridine13 synthase